ncbi:MAG: TrkH family potassium uptake protein [Anaerolineae bacterium]
MRYREYLIRRYRALLGYSGLLLMIIGVMLLAPLLVIPFFPEEIRYAGSFILTTMTLIVPGYMLWRLHIPKDPISLTVQESMVIVVIIWLVAIICAALPFMTVLNLNFTQAIFETTSGLTTTGLSVVDVTTAPHVILFYRSYIQLLGGAGFVIIALSAIAGPAGPGLSIAEGRGEQLAPHVRESAAIVLRIYIAYIVIGVLALILAGMGPFDAVNHAFAAIATGGFSTKPESIGYWDSPLIEAIIMVLMLLGALNFLTAYTLLRRKFGPIVRNGEVRLQTTVIIIASISLLVITTSSLYPTFEKSLRVALFETVSALSGTGYSTVSHINWNAFGLLLMSILMTIGGGTSSTAGGLKQYRVYVLYKAIKWEFWRAFLPQHVINQPAVWQGQARGFLTDERVRQVALFAFLYLAVLVLGTAVVAAHGYPLGESLYEFSSALGTAGLSVGITHPEAPSSLLWTFTIGMFLGRLEFFAVLIGLAKLAADIRILIQSGKKRAV